MGPRKLTDEFVERATQAAHRERGLCRSIQLLRVSLRRREEG